MRFHAARVMMTPLLSIFAACASPRNNIPPVTSFDLNRYLGTWYEVARYPHSFEKNLSNVSASYRPSGGRLIVENRGYDPKAGKWKSVKGAAKFAGPQDVGLLKVTFFWPFSGVYKVAWLADDYRRAVVVSSNYSYLWLLARSPQIDKAEYEEMVGIAERLGFTRTRLQQVEHGAAPAPRAPRDPL